MALDADDWGVAEATPSDREIEEHDAGYAITRLVQLVHERNVAVGWWSDLYTNMPLDRNVGEMLMLVVSEISEAMEGHRKSLYDDHIIGRPMVEVELADALIRIFDIAGGIKFNGQPLDLGGAFEEKMAYNRERLDHKAASRLEENGKKY